MTCIHTSDAMSQLPRPVVCIPQLCQRGIRPSTAGNAGRELKVSLQIGGRQVLMAVQMSRGGRHEMVQVRYNSIPAMRRTCAMNSSS